MLYQTRHKFTNRLLSTSPRNYYQYSTENGSFTNTPSIYNEGSGNATTIATAI